jgi:ABC-type bacteriocin/lantibiotic exporter with double-glycine peptidase domain
MSVTRIDGASGLTHESTVLVRTAAGWRLSRPDAPADGERALLVPLRPLGHDHAGHLSPWARVRALIALERGEIAAVVAYAALGALLSLAVPVAVQSLVNTLLFGTLVTPVLWTAALVAAGLLGAMALQLAQIWTVELLQRRIFVNIVAELAWRLPRAELAALDGEHRFRLANRFLDVVVVQKAVAKLLTDGVGSAVAAVAGTVLLAFYHPYLLGYAVALWLLVGMVVLGWGRGAVRTAVAESYAKHAVAGWVEELLAHPNVVRGDGGIAWSRARGEVLTGTYLDTREAHFRSWFSQVAALLGIYALASAALLSIGGVLVVSGQLGVGQLIAAELVVSAVLGSLAKLGKQLEKVYDMLAGLDKIGHLLEIPVQSTATAPRSLPPGPATLEADAVGYTYEDGRVAFDAITIEAHPGDLVVITGPTGSGRRTLLELLAGQRTPPTGSVRLGGIRLDSLAPDARAAALVLVRGADVVEGTVRENVHMGRTNVADSTVDAALARVGLAADVERMPVDQLLAPDGRPLSEGKALRLVLARALAGTPRVLLVDARHPAIGALAAQLRDPSRVTVLLSEDPALVARATHVVQMAGGAS